ncbi:myb proto-oncogene protein [Vigna unguiculata]|uniref:Myb proto-oncogene protein n=1 Tax=Vigna unguiculata TaxID=3917 RepID=A0A4D6N004_VIGUN|nr:myb proto-oncogene protein [Vigna unguiculata]
MGRHSCCYKQKLRKGLWSPEEDEKLLDYITKHGHGCWSSVPKLVSHNSSPHSTKTPFAGFNTFLLTYTWEDTLVAINRSYGKAFGLQRKMRSF